MHNVRTVLRDPKNYQLAAAMMAMAGFATLIQPSSWLAMLQAVSWAMFALSAVAILALARGILMFGIPQQSTDAHWLFRAAVALVVPGASGAFSVYLAQQGGGSGILVAYMLIASCTAAMGVLVAEMLRGGTPPDADHPRGDQLRVVAILLVTQSTAGVIVVEMIERGGGFGALG